MVVICRIFFMALSLLVFLFVYLESSIASLYFFYGDTALVAISKKLIQRLQKAETSHPRNHLCHKVLCEYRAHGVANGGG